MKQWREFGCFIFDMCAIILWDMTQPKIFITRVIPDRGLLLIKKHFQPFNIALSVRQKKGRRIRRAVFLVIRKKLLARIILLTDLTRCHSERSEEPLRSSQLDFIHSIIHFCNVYKGFFSAFLEQKIVLQYHYYIEKSEKIHYVKEMAVLRVNSSVVCSSNG